MKNSTTLAVRKKFNRLSRSVVVPMPNTPKLERKMRGAKYTLLSCLPSTDVSIEKIRSAARPVERAEGSRTEKFDSPMYPIAHSGLFVIFQTVKMGCHPVA